MHPSHTLIAPAHFSFLNCRQPKPYLERLTSIFKGYLSLILQRKIDHVDPSLDMYLPLMLCNVLKDLCTYKNFVSPFLLKRHTRINHHLITIATTYFLFILSVTPFVCGDVDTYDLYVQMR